jgi:nicotinamidase-related amidase
VEPDSTLRPELPGNAFKDEVKPLPHEKTFSKTVNSAFIGTGLEQYLRESGISALVITGLTTDHCVSASTRMASDLGFEVDGEHYSGETIHRVNLASLNGEFCRVCTTAELLDGSA